MPQAKIKINGVIGSNDDLPINTLVQLDNQNSGGETTWAWTIVSQPEGPNDVLSNANIQNPTFTPTKEGTYLLKIVVNQGQGSEASDQQIAGIRYVETRQRAPAGGEESEDNATVGWALALNRILALVNKLGGNDTGCIVCNASEAMGRGNTVRFSGAQKLLSGLPGERFVPTVSIAHGNVAAELKDMLGIVERNVDGTTTAIANQLVIVRVRGMIGPLPAAFVAGDLLYVKNAGELDNAPGTTKRLVGKVLANPPPGNGYYAMFDGLGMDAARVVPDFESLGAAVLDGTLNVTGLSTLAALTVGGILTANGAATFNALLTAAAALAISSGDITLTQAALQSILKSGGDLKVGTSENHDVYLRSNAVDRWKMDKATGALSGQGGNKQISNVADPVAAQDAVTKTYDDAPFTGQRAFVNAVTPTTTAQGILGAPPTIATLAITVPAGFIADIFLEGSVEWYAAAAAKRMYLFLERSGTILDAAPRDTFQGANNNETQAFSTNTVEAGMAAGTYNYHLKIASSDGVTNVTANLGDFSAIMMLRRS